MFFCNFYTDSKKFTNQTGKYYMATARNCRFSTQQDKNSHRKQKLL